MSSHTDYDRLENLFAPRSVYAFDGLYGITLVPYLPELYVSGRTNGYRIYVSVKDARNIPTKIFMYQRKPILTGNTPYKDDFSHVASAVDLEEFPEDTPDSTTRPFFRLDTVDIVVRNIDLAVDVVQGLADDVHELVRSRGLLDRLVVVGDIQIGNPETSSSSSSSSSS